MSASTKLRRTSRSIKSTESGFRSLLVAIDLTPSSDRVLGRLPLLPLAGDARVTVLHVVPGGLTHNEQRRAEREAVRAVAEEVRHARASLPRGVHVQPLVKVGTAARVISATAATVKAELVVMGRGSEKALRDQILGATAERVIRRGQVPVLVVRLAPRARYARPALAMAVDEAAYRAIALMLRVLPTPPPDVTVIHAFDTPYHSYIYSSVNADEEQERMDELERKATRQVSSLLGKALTRANVAPADAPAWKTHIRLGSPRLVVERALKKGATDLLVLGTRGRSGAPWLLLGTVAGDVLRRSTCDVLVVPPDRAR